VSLWAISQVVSRDPVQDVDLQTSYEAALIYASLAAVPPSEAQVENMKQKAALALTQDVDRMVKTAKRVIKNVVFKKLDYSITTELSKATLRAFGGGLEPVRSLDDVVNAPRADFFPYVYATRLFGPFIPNNIVMTEVKAERWDYRVQGIQGRMPGVERSIGSFEYAPHVIHGGNNLVFASTRACVKEPFPCRQLTFSVYTTPLDAPADAEPIRLTPVDNRLSATTPKWSPDEEKIVLTAGPTPIVAKVTWTNVWIINKDGSGPVKLTDGGPGVFNTYPEWSPDGGRIIYGSNRTGNWEVWIMNADGSGDTNLSNAPGSNEREPSLSPDGRYIAFISDRDGDDEVFVMKADGSETTQLTSNSKRDFAPSWSHDALNLVYTSGDQYKGSRLSGLSVLTGERVYDFGDFAAAPSYESPVWAATQHVLVPSEAAVLTSALKKGGYLTLSDVLANSRAQGTNPSGQRAYEIKKGPNNPLSDYRYEIHSAYTQSPRYLSDLGGYFPAPISWP